MAKRKARRISKPQPEQNVMLFEPVATAHTIDLAACLTAINRKQYHQTKNLKPLAYHFRAQAIDVDSSSIQFTTAPNTWTTRNAVIKLGAMYRKHLSNNGLRLSQLPKYGREMRLGLETGKGYTHGEGSDGFAASATLATSGTAYALPPRSGHVGGSGTVFTSYTNTDGDSATFYNTNDLTLISVPETAADGEPETVVVSLLGTTDHGANDLALIPEYLGSRRNADDDVEVDAHFPEDTNLLMRIGSTADEHFDDVIDALEETGDMRPYDEAGANSRVLQGALMANGDYCSGIAPLGLLRFDGTADQEFIITVTAITEM